MTRSRSTLICATRAEGLPEGLRHVGSWVEPSFARCFQLMECEDARLIQQWVLHWRGLATFEIVPVVSGKDTAAVVAPHLPDALAVRDE